VATRPQLWLVALRQAARLVPLQWWRRGPWPARDYMRFRAETQYGDARHALDPGDVVNYLAWCRRMEHMR
jgi:hypothetical protein